MSTVGAPVGFIEPPGDPGGVETAVANGVVAAVGAVGSLLINTYDLLRGIFQTPSSFSGFDWGSINSGATRGEFAGPAPEEGGGYWAGDPTSTSNWVISGLIENEVIPDHGIAAGNSGISATYSMVGPIREPLPNQFEFVFRFDGYGPNGEKTAYYLQNPYGNGAYVLSEGFYISSEFNLSKGFLQPPQPPEPFPEEERRVAPPVPTPNPNPSPKPSISPRVVPTPNPGPGEPQPNPSPNPPPQPNPGPGEPQPNPNPQPQPNTFPITPLPFPIPQPNNPTQTNPNGTTQAAPQTKPTTTPTDAHVVDNKVITNTGPQPSLDGIAKEVGRIESKLASVMKSAPLKDPLEWDEIISILRLLKDLFDGITDNEPQSAYQISSPCELDDQEQRIVFASTIAASTDKFSAIINRINAVADLLQHSKNLKQPLCPGQRFPVSGQAVTVNFTQID